MYIYIYTYIYIYIYIYTYTSIYIYTHIYDMMWLSPKHTNMIKPVCKNSWEHTEFHGETHGEMSGASRVGLATASAKRKMGNPGLLGNSRGYQNIIIDH